jgi:hypothetical protein
MNVIPSFRPCACLIRRAFAAALALLVGQAVTGFAQTVLIDFGDENTYRSLSVLAADSNGNYWNSIQPGLLIENLVDLDDVPTTIDIGWDTPVGFDSYNGPAGATGPADVKADLRAFDLPFTDIDPVALGNLGGALEGAFDYITGPGPEDPDKRVRFQIQNLNPSQTYDLTFFGSHSYSDDALTEFTIYSDSTYTTQVASVSLEVRDPTEFWLHNRDAVATLTGLTPQTDNILYVQFVGAFGNLGYLNAMQIASLAAPGIDGDYNDDGEVDAADYVVWRKVQGTTTVLPNDPDGGTIDNRQYATWRENFGAGGSGSGGSSAVPEPGALMLALVAIGLFSFDRRR